jgi:hypothetical protein
MAAPAMQRLDAALRELGDLLLLHRDGQLDGRARLSCICSD